jgi:hypothetical protein
MTISTVPTQPTLMPVAPRVAVRLGGALLLLGTLACGTRPVPAAVTATSAALLPPLEPAVIALPITIPSAAVQARLDQALPRSDSLDRARCQAAGGVVCHQYVFARDTLGVRFTGDRVDLLARLRYRGRVAVASVASLGSCGYAPEPMRRAELRLATSLYWRSDWRLASRNTTLTTTLPDPCEVTVLRVDATPLMRRMADAQLARVAQQVDSALPALADLRPVADSLWRTLQEPIPLDSAGSLWLVMSPEQVGLAPLEGRGLEMRTGVALVARPRIVSGARPSVSVRPLPSLTLATHRAGLRVPVQVEVPFAEVGRRATELLAAETARQPLRVTRVDVSGTGDTAVVKLSLAGRMNGTLHLVGRPRFDAGSRTLVVDDLRYTVESRDVLTRLKATLGAPLIKRAIDQATGGGRLALGPQLDSARMQLTHRLNGPVSPDLVVGGGVRSLTVTGVHTTPTAFVLRVLLEGDAGLWAR